MVGPSTAGCFGPAQTVGAGPFLGAALDQPGAVKRLALMEYDIRPHEAYDEVVAAIFIVFMLVVTVLIFTLS